MKIVGRSSHCIAFLAALFLQGTAAGKNPLLNCPNLTGAPAIDDDLSDDVWRRRAAA